MFFHLRQLLPIWLIRKIQKYGPHRVEVLGNIYEISEDVFNPKFYFTSVFMAKHIKVRTEDIVLDIGTGSGIQAITAGKTASKVVAVDINPEAVRFASRNVVANSLEQKISVIHSDLFNSLDPGCKFDVILFTPPYLKGVVKTHLDHALFDSGKKLVHRFFREAKDYINPEGYIMMVYSSIAEPEEALETARLSGWEHTLITREKTFTEEFLIYELRLV